MYSDARGSVKITSRRPARASPALRFNYLSTDQDRREWVEAVRVARHILDQPAFAPFNGGETLARAGGGDRRARSSTGSRSDAETALHPSCTARMGTDEARSSTRARCACTASTGCASWTRRRCPYVTNGNIYAPVMMLAEKAADLILGNTPLPPQHDAVLPPRDQ